MPSHNSVLSETIENDHKAFKYDILVKNGPIRTEYVHVFDTVFWLTVF
jgi:hypothetical protein